MATLAEAHDAKLLLKQAYGSRSGIADISIGRADSGYCVKVDVDRKVKLPSCIGNVPVCIVVIGHKLIPTGD